MAAIAASDVTVVVTERWWRMEDMLWCLMSSPEFIFVP